MRILEIKQNHIFKNPNKKTLERFFYRKRSNFAFNAIINSDDFYISISPSNTYNDIAKQVNVQNFIPLKVNKNNISLGDLKIKNLNSMKTFLFLQNIAKKISFRLETDGDSLIRTYYQNFSNINVYGKLYNEWITKTQSGKYIEPGAHIIYNNRFAVVDSGSFANNYAISPKDKINFFYIDVAQNPHFEYKSIGFENDPFPANGRKQLENIDRIVSKTTFVGNEWDEIVKNDNWLNKIQQEVNKVPQDYEYTHVFFDIKLSGTDIVAKLINPLPMDYYKNHVLGKMQFHKLNRIDVWKRREEKWLEDDREQDRRGSR